MKPSSMARRMVYSWNERKPFFTFGAGVPKSSSVLPFGVAVRAWDLYRLHQLRDSRKVTFGGHDEQAPAATPRCPYCADCALFLCVSSVVEMLSFVFHCKHATVCELAEKVWITPICGSLQPERRSLPREISHPELHFRQSVEVLRALKFLGRLAACCPLVQLARLRTEIVLLELEAAFVEPAWFVAYGLEVDRAFVAHRERRFWQEEALKHHLPLAVAMLLNTRLDCVA